MVQSTFENPVAAVAFAVGTEEAAQKTVKLGQDGIRLYSLYAGQECFGELLGLLKSADKFFDFVSVFATARGIVYPNESGRYVWSLPEDRKWECREKVSLFAFKTLQFTLDERLGFLGRDTFSQQIGPFVAYKATMDFLVLTFSTCSLLNIAYYEQPKLNADVAATGKKLERWHYKNELQAYGKSGMNATDDKGITTKQKSEALKEYYTAKCASLEKAKTGIPAEITKTTCPIRKAQLEEQLKNLPAKAARANEKLTALGKTSLQEQAVPFVAQKENKKIDAKIEHFKGVQETNGVRQNNIYWKAANAIGKIAYVLFSNFIIATNATLVLPLLLLKTTVDAIGWGKLIYRQMYSVPA